MGNTTILPAGNSTGPFIYATLAERPTAATFGIGQCQIGATVYVSDGVSWIASGDTVSLTANDSSYITAAANLVKIQASLDGLGKLILTTPGDYYLNGTIIVPSDSHIGTGPGVNLKRVGISQTYDAVKMLRNAHWDSVVYPVTGNVQGVAVGVSDLAFVYDVDINVASHSVTSTEKYVLIKGDKTELYNGVHKVIKLTATKITVRMYYTSSGMPVSSGALTVANADANITLDVQGDIDGQHGAVISVGNQIEGLDSMLAIFNKVGNLQVRQFNGAGVKKYILLLGNIYHGRFNNLNFQNRSDGIHFQPPYRDIVVDGVTGNTGDDAIAVTTIDYSAYSVPDATNGDCQGLSINNVAMTTCANAIALYPSGNYKLKDVVLNNVTCLDSSAGSVINISGFVDAAITGTVTSGSANITALSGLPTYYPNITGFFVSGAGIPDNTYIVSHTAGVAVMNNTATSTATGSITLSGLSRLDEVTIDAPIANQKLHGLVKIYECEVNSINISNVRNPVATPNNDLFLKATFTTADANITVQSTTGMYKGMPVNCVGIASGSFVVSVTDATHFVCSSIPTSNKTNVPLRCIYIQGQRHAMLDLKQQARLGKLKISTSDLYIDCTDAGYDRAVVDCTKGTNISVGEVVFNNVSVTGIGSTASYSIIKQNNSGNCSSVKANNFSLRGFGNLIDGGNTPVIVNCSNVDLINAQFLVGDISTGSTIKIDNIQVTGALSGAILNLYGASKTYNLMLGKIINNGGQALFNYGTTHTLNLLASDGTVNVDGSKFAPSAGAIFYNSNAAFGAGVGLYAFGTVATRISV